MSDLIRQRAVEQPEGVAYRFLSDGETEEHQLTYAELARQAASVGRWLRECVPAGERALLFYPPGLEYVTAFFGCLYAGVIPVPAYPPRPNQNLQRLRAIATDARAEVALTTSKIRERVEAQHEKFAELGALRWLASDAVEPDDGADDWHPFDAQPDTLAYLQYTSGSTASPKGVMVSHANVLHNAAYIHDGFGHTPESIALTWLPHFHDMGLIDGIIVPLFGGFPGILMPPTSFLQRPARWLEAIMKYGVTHTGGPNFAYDLCVRKVSAAQRATLDLSTWQVAYNGAEPVRQKTLEEFAAAFHACGFRKRAFYPAYGLAEATLKVTGGERSEEPVYCAVRADALERNRVEEPTGGDEATHLLVGAGRAGHGTLVAIVNPETSRRCTPGEVGEIWVSGAGVAQGYWNRPDETEQTFRAFTRDTREGPFLRTGDLGFVKAGELFITGRLKDLIIVRGRNHYPQDIEWTVEASHASLRAGAGIAFSIETQGEEQLVIVQELELRRQADAAEAIDAIRQAVAKQHEVQVDAVLLVKPGGVPKTSSGKLQRHAGRKKFLEDAFDVVAQWRETGALVETTENTVPVSLRDITHVESWLRAQLALKRGVDASQINLHQPIALFCPDSLAAIELMHSIEEGLGVSLPLVSFLQDFSIAQLAEQVMAAVPESFGGEQESAASSEEEIVEQPLSYGQQAMWFIYRFAPESPAYNIAVPLQILAELDRDALHRTFDALVERHPSLRTTFAATEGAPVQRIHRRMPVSFVEVGASGWSEATLNERLEAEARRPFNLEEGPLLRVFVFTRSPQSHVLFFVVHHIAADFWSLAVLMDELGALYRAEKEGKPVVLAPLAMEYADYARWQAAMLAGQQGERLRAYWEQQLSGDLPVLNLPTDRPRPAVQTYRGASQSFKLDAHLMRSLKEMGQARGATLYMTLLAAFQVLLYRYTGQEEIIVGSPTAGRSRRRWAGVVGYFVNPIALRATLSGEMAFEEFLSQVRSRVLSAFEHQDYPFPLLVERLQPERDPSRTPFFQCLFALQKAHLQNAAALSAFALGEAGARAELGGLPVESLSLEQRTAQFDLTLLAAEDEDGLTASLQYNTDLFDASTIKRMIGHFAELLRSIAREPQRALAHLSLLDDAERRQLLVEWNDTKADYPAGECLHELFERQAEKSPAKTALEFNGRELSYAELNRRANMLAHHLRNLGVVPEEAVGILTDRSTEMVVAILGVLKAGGTYLPLDPAYPQERLSFMLQDASTRFLLTKHFLLERLPDTHGAQAICLDTEWEAIARAGDANIASGVSSNNLAYLIYTSGSTGRPKGVCIEHRNAVTLIHWAREIFPPEDLEGVLAATSISFDLSVFELFVPLSWGGKVILAENALYLPDLPAAKDVRLVNTVPSVLAELLHIGNIPASVRTVNLAGEALPESLVTRIYEQKTIERVLNLYGPSEDTTYSTFASISRDATMPTIGRPIANTRAYILDAHLQPLPAGLHGEIYLGGAGLARGYLNRPELTAERFIPDALSGEAGARLYRTGDIGCYGAGGELEYVGRADHQVKVRGFRIELGEIETVLAQHPAVRQVTIITRDDDARGKHLVAYVVAEGGSPIESRQLRRHLKERLPEYMVPAAFVFLEELPLTPNGKIDRRKLSEIEATAAPEAVTTPAAQGTPVEELLAGIWSQLLGVGEVGTQDNFFELGGHSLLATQVFSRVSDIFKVDLPVRSLFESPTPGALAVQIERAMLEEPQRQFQPLVPVVRDNLTPLSYAQQRLWFFDQLEPGNALYNMAAAIRMSGRLDTRALERSINETVRRHEVLRTTFMEIEGTPLQVISASLHLGVRITDLLSLPDGQREQALHRLASEEARLPFDLTHGPLLRAHLLRLDEDEHVLLMTMHHIVSDGWSLGVFMRELKVLYEAFSLEQSPDLPELAVQYADYALWQHKRFSCGQLDADLAYWRHQLAGAPSALSLPGDHARPPVQTHRGALYHFELPATLAADLKGLSRREGVTLFMTLLAGFKALLSRYTSEQDIVVGTPIAGRNRAETEALIGFFVNTLALRTDLGGEPSFRELLGRVRETALSAYAHQEVPFERLVEELQVERSLSHAPLFQVMFALNNTPQARLELAGLEVRVEAVGSGVAKFDLSLSVEEESEGHLRCAVEYSTDIYEEATIERMMRHYAHLLAVFAAAPARPLSHVPMLLPEEQSELLLEWNKTERAFPSDKCLHELFAAQAARAPQATAVIAEDGELSYGELNARANRLAHYLRKRGVGAESRVGVRMERSLEMMVGLLGVLKAGGAYVPLDPDYSGERLAHIIADTRTSVLLTQQHLGETATVVGADVVCVDTQSDEIALESETDPELVSEPENLACLLFTSASTDSSKGVMLSHRAVCNYMHWMQEEFPLDASDRVLQKTPFSFDASLWEIYAPLLSGAQLVLAQPGAQTDSGRLLRTMAARGITVVRLVPTLLQIVLDEPELTACTGLRRVFVGGETLTTELQERFFARLDAELVGLYGSPETTADAAFRRCTSATGLHTVSLGRPIANTRAYILDAHLQPLPAGLHGEIYLGGAGLARGYLNRPELTAERFIPDALSGEAGARLYRTGDIGCYGAGGELEYVGRADHQVKVRGFRIELGEIETALAQHETIAGAVVIHREERAAAHDELVAYLMPQPGQTAIARAGLQQYLKQHLPDHMIPQVFHWLDSFPLTPDGKVDRHALAAIEDETPQVVAGTELPLTPVQEMVANVWAEVLGVKDVGAGDDFFELGGHSLLATRVASRLRHSFGMELSLRALFEYPVLGALAAHIEEERAGVRPPVGEVIEAAERRGDEVALSYAQQRLWFLDQLEAKRNVYNEPAAARLSGKLDVTALESALAEIIRRHEALRTTFVMREQGPVQIIHPPQEFTLPVVPLDEIPETERDAEVARLMKEEAELPFDLATGPLLRAKLLRLQSEEHVLLFTMHHIISDGWSMGVLTSELATLYDAFSKGLPSPLAVLPVQYADYAVWQRRWLRGEVLQKQIDYWRQQLSGSPPLLELPGDRPRPFVQSQRGAREPLELPGDLTRSLKGLSRREGVTLFMTLLAGFKALLSRYTGEQDIVVGTPIAGRNRAETEALIGFFVNTLALRTDLGGEPSFRELLGRVRETALSAYAHQEVPFERLVEELQVERSLSHAPLFQVMLGLQNASKIELKLHGLRSNLLPTNSGTSKFDLLLQLEESEQGVSGFCEYNADIFDGVTVRRMMNHYRRLLESIAEYPERKLAALPLLEQSERHQLLFEWNDTRREYPDVPSVLSLFEMQVERTPDSLALALDDEQLTYRELNRRANQLANYLRARGGVVAETRVGICVERSVEMLLAVLAVLKAGGACVPLDSQSPQDNRAFILADAQVELLVTQRRFRDDAETSNVRAIYLDVEDGEIARANEAAVASGIKADNLAYVIYTPGATGRPEGAAVHHGGLANLIAWQIEQPFLSAPARTLQYSALDIDVSFQEIFSTWCSGGTLLLVTEQVRRDKPEFWRFLDDKKIERLFIPSGELQQLAKIASATNLLPAHLGDIVVSGTQLQVTRHLVALLTKLRGCRLHNHYRTSETHVVATHTLIGEPSAWPTLPPIGRPIANARLYVLDENLEPVPVGVKGELYIGGISPGRGYPARPELTAEKFIPDPFSIQMDARMYRTGDMARRRPDGQIQVLGRADQQVKIRGFRVELGEIEAVLVQHERVAEAVVIAHEASGGVRQLVAYVVGLEGGAGAVTTADLRRHLKEHLPEYMMPATFVWLEALPLTPNGKVDRRALPAPQTQGAETSDKFIAPRQPVEEMLAGIWAEVLGVKDVGAGDDFFELGGHSLLATRVASRLRHSFGMELSLRALFEYPVLGALAAHIEEERAGVRPPVGEVIEAAERRGDEVALSYAQQRLWFLDQLEPGSSFYNLASKTHLYGELDIPALEKSLNEIIRRHETLRTNFVNKEGKPLGVVAAPTELTLHVHDLSDLTEDTRELELQRMVAEEAGRPFDLSRGHMLRAELIKAADEQHVLLITMHHIASDGWSLGVLIRELATLYAAYSTGELPLLPELAVQYADYALWQHKRFSCGQLDADLAYWRHQLAGAPSALSLPGDHARPPVQTHRGALYQFELPATLAADLKGLSRREGVTLFMTLLAGFKALLSRYTGEQDIVVGTPIAGRNRAETEALIGFFVNTLALRTDLGGEPSFRELLGRVRETALSAYAHQEVPFERLVEELQVERSLSHAPLFQVMFALNNTPQARLELAGLEVRVEAVGSGVAKFDLSLSVEEESEGHLRCAVEYSTDIYEEATIERMMRHYARLLEAFTAAPDKRLSALDLLAPRERQQLLAEWNSTHVAYERELCLHELFEQQAARTPDAVALVSEGQQLSYRELNERANRLAHYLRKRGVGAESRVGVRMERSVEMMVGLLGVLKAGGAYVPLDGRYPAERLRQMVEDAGVEVVLRHGERDREEAEKEYVAAEIWMEAERAAIERESAEGVGQVSGADNAAYVIYTSGSTGKPKGVCCRHAGVVNVLSDAQRRQPFTSGEAHSFWTSLSFDVSVFEIFSALLSGGTLHIVPEQVRTDGRTFIEWLSTNRIRGAYVPAFMLADLLAWLEMDGHTLDLRRMLVGVEPIEEELLEAIQARVPSLQIVNGYGPTEATIYVTLYEVSGEHGRRGRTPIGRPIQNTQVYLLNSAMQPVPVGVVGELYVGGEGLARGYLGDPALTAARFVPDPFDTRGGSRLYRTGDVGRYLSDGNILFTGRADHQIKLRGFRIEPAEIEAALAGHEAVLDSLVVVREDISDDKRLVAYLTAKDGARPGAAQLREYLKNHLPGHMIPSAFVWLESYPLLPSGKIDRRALPAPERSRADGDADFIAPRTEVERRLADVWSEMLQIERVGVHDNFFELGGHSLLATQIVWKIREAFEADVPLRILFEHSTIAELAGVIERAQSAKVEPRPPAIRRRSREQYRVPVLSSHSNEVPEVPKKA